MGRGEVKGRTMVDRAELVRAVRDICNSALNAELHPEFDLDMLSRIWPEEAEELEHPLFSEVYEDLTDAMAHMPASLQWSGYFEAVYLDWVVLGYDRTLDELLACRNSLRKQDAHLLPEDEVQAKAKEYFDTHPSS